MKLFTLTTLSQGPKMIWDLVDIAFIISQFALDVSFFDLFHCCKIFAMTKMQEFSFKGTKMMRYVCVVFFLSVL